MEWLEWFRKNKVLYFLNLFPCCVQQYPGTSKTCVHVSHVCNIENFYVSVVCKFVLLLLGTLWVLHVVKQIVVRAHHMFAARPLHCLPPIGVPCTDTRRPGVSLSRKLFFRGLPGRGRRRWTMRHPPHFGRTLATVGGRLVVVVVGAVDVPTFGHRGGRGQCSGSGGGGARTVVVVAKPIVGFQMPPKSAVGTGRRSSLVGTATAGTGTGTVGTGALQVVRDERVVRAGVGVAPWFHV